MSLKGGNRQYKTNTYIICQMAINAMKKKAIKEDRVIERRQVALL